jgi:DNA gyrase subunit A
VVIDMDIVHEGATVLIVTENGYGKRTPIEEYRAQTRGGKGIKTLNVTQRNGAIVGLKVIRAEDDIMIITQAGVLIRLNVDTISTMGRYTQGVRLIRLDGEDQRVATVARVEKSEVEEE